jgi:hypothetical protein
MVEKSLVSSGVRMGPREGAADGTPPERDPATRVALLAGRDGQYNG